MDDHIRIRLPVWKIFLVIGISPDVTQPGRQSVADAACTWGGGDVLWLGLKAGIRPTRNCEVAPCSFDHRCKKRSEKIKKNVG